MGRECLPTAQTRSLTRRGSARALPGAPCVRVGVGRAELPLDEPLRAGAAGAPSRCPRRSPRRRARVELGLEATSSPSAAPAVDEVRAEPAVELRVEVLVVEPLQGAPRAPGRPGSRRARGARAGRRPRAPSVETGRETVALPRAGRVGRPSWSEAYSRLRATPCSGRNARRLLHPLERLLRRRAVDLELHAVAGVRLRRGEPLREAVGRLGRVGARRERHDAHLVELAVGEVHAAQRRLLARRVGVEAEVEARVRRRSSRSWRSVRAVPIAATAVREPRLMEGEHVGVALDDDRAVLLRDRRPRPVEAVDERCLVEELALGRVHVLRLDRVAAPTGGGRRSRARARGHRRAGRRAGRRSSRSRGG